MKLVKKENGTYVYITEVKGSKLAWNFTKNKSGKYQIESVDILNVTDDMSNLNILFKPIERITDLDLKDINDEYFQPIPARPPEEDKLDSISEFEMEENFAKEEKHSKSAKEEFPGSVGEMHISSQNGKFLRIISGIYSEDALANYEFIEVEVYNKVCDRESGKTYFFDSKSKKYVSEDGSILDAPEVILNDEFLMVIIETKKRLDKVNVVDGKEGPEERIELYWGIE